MFIIYYRRDSHGGWSGVDTLQNHNVHKPTAHDYPLSTINIL